MAAGQEVQAGAPERRRRAYLPAAERRASILAAARRVFAEANLKGARTRDIAREAGVNQATVFEHFSSKEELFHAAVVEPLLAALQGRWDQLGLYETARSPDDLAGLALASARGHVEDAIDTFPLLAAALFSDPDLGRSLYRQHIAPLIRRRGEVLDSLARDGLDRDFIGLANFGMLMAIGMDRHLGDHARAPDLDHLARQFTRMATGGFARGAEGEAIDEAATKAS